MPHKRKRGGEKKMKKDIQLRKTLCKVMGCGENKLMAQQVQEAVHKIRKEDSEYHGLVQLSCSVIIYRKVIFGIGSVLLYSSFMPKLFF